MPHGLLFRILGDIPHFDATLLHAPFEEGWAYCIARRLVSPKLVQLENPKPKRLQTWSNVFRSNVLWYDGPLGLCSSDSFLHFSHTYSEMLSLYFFLLTSDEVPVPSVCVNFCWSSASF